MMIMVMAILDQAMVEVVMMRVVDVVATIILPTLGMGLLFM